MENKEQQNQTPSAQVSLEVSDEYNKAFDNAMKILADLPTERAMLEISKGRRGDACQKVCETMALSKMDLVRSMSLMRFREALLRREIELLTTKLPATDKAIMDFVKENPNYEVVAND